MEVAGSVVQQERPETVSSTPGRAHSRLAKRPKRQARIQCVRWGPVGICSILCRTRIRTQFVRQEGDFSMNRLQLTALGFSMLLISLSCASSSGNGGDDGSTKLRKNVLVQINELHVRPEVVRVPADGNRVSWTNWTGSIAAISFPASVAKAFTCSEIRPDFVLNGPRVESIYALGSNEDLTTPCPLKPGTYTYQVGLYDTPGNRYNPRVTFSGTIEVVE